MTILLEARAGGLPQQHFLPVLAGVPSAPDTTLVDLPDRSLLSFRQGDASSELRSQLLALQQRMGRCALPRAFYRIPERHARLRSLEISNAAGPDLKAEPVSHAPTRLAVDALAHRHQGHEHDLPTGGAHRVPAPVAFSVESTGAQGAGLPGHEHHSNVVPLNAWANILRGTTEESCALALVVSLSQGVEHRTELHSHLARSHRPCPRDGCCRPSPTTRRPAVDAPDRSGRGAPRGSRSRGADSPALLGAPFRQVHRRCHWVLLNGRMGRRTFRCPGSFVPRRAARCLGRARFRKP